MPESKKAPERQRDDVASDGHNHRRRRLPKAKTCTTISSQVSDAALGGDLEVLAPRPRASSVSSGHSLPSLCPGSPCLLGLSASLLGLQPATPKSPSPAPPGCPSAGDSSPPFPTTRRCLLSFQPQTVGHVPLLEKPTTAASPGPAQWVRPSLHPGGLSVAGDSATPRLPLVLSLLPGPSLTDLCFLGPRDYGPLRPSPELCFQSSPKLRLPLLVSSPDSPLILKHEPVCHSTSNCPPRLMAPTTAALGHLPSPVPASWPPLGVLMGSITLDESCHLLSQNSLWPPPDIPPHSLQKNWGQSAARPAVGAAPTQQVSLL